MAIAEFRAAVKLRPNHVDAINNLGVALQCKGELEAAIECYRRAMQLKPGYVEACINLGNAMKDRGRLNEALLPYGHASPSGPEDTRVGCNRLFAIQYHADYGAAAILREARVWNERYAKPLAAEIPRHENDRDPGRRLRIGYVSPDFRNHCQSHFHDSAFVAPRSREI